MSSISQIPNFVTECFSDFDSEKIVNIQVVSFCVIAGALGAAALRYYRSSPNNIVSPMNRVFEESKVQPVIPLIERVQVPKEIDLIGNTKLGINTVKEASENGIDLNQKDAEGNTPLHWAVSKGHYGIVKTLLEKNADPTICNNSGENLLHVACENQQTDILRILVGKGIGINDKNEKGMTPLMIGARSGFLRIVEFLVNQSGIDLDVTNEMKETALHLASIEKAAVAKKLIENGADVNLADKEGKLALHIAAYNENLELLPTLLEKTKNSNCQDYEGNTPLHQCVDHIHERIKSAEILLKDPKIDPNILNNEGEAPLHIACQLMTIKNDLALLMIRSGKCDLNFPTNDAKGKLTPMHIVLQLEGKERIKTGLPLIQALIEIKADLTTPNKEGVTPLEMLTLHREYFQEMIPFLNKGSLEKMKIKDLPLIDYAVFHLQIEMEKTLNKMGIYFTYEAEKKDEMVNTLLRIFSEQWKEGYGKSRIKVKEIEEFLDDIKNLHREKVESKQPVIMKFAKDMISQFLERKKTLSELAKQGKAIPFIDLFFGNLLDWGSFFQSSYFSEEAKSKLKKDIKENFKENFIGLERFNSVPSFPLEVSLGQIETALQIINLVRQAQSD